MGRFMPDGLLGRRVPIAVLWCSFTIRLLQFCNFNLIPPAFSPLGGVLIIQHASMRDAGIVLPRTFASRTLSAATEEVCVCMYVCMYTCIYVIRFTNLEIAHTHQELLVHGLQPKWRSKWKLRLGWR